MPLQRRAKAAATRSKAQTLSQTRASNKATSRPKLAAKLLDSDDEHVKSRSSSDDYHVESDEGEEESPQELDSDALDEDEDLPSRKRKRTSASKRSPKKKTLSSKRRKSEESDEWDEEEDIGEGREIVGKVIRAPKTGRVAPGMISQNTLSFLSQLKKPECNDREWFKLHEPVFRLAEREWKDFVEKFTEDLIEIDPQIPPLPPKDVIHRIYRDIRFRADKTPYKTGFSATFSRSGRKGIFAVYHVAIKPDGESLVAAGAWCPGRNELQTIRNHIQRNSSRLRRVLSAPRFVELFGEPKPGARRSIFGQEDELKVAPKGIDKNHKDIDLLKCRSFAVYHHFSDEDVLKSNFRGQLIEAIKIVRPLVHCLNDYITLPTGEASEGSGEDEDSENGQLSGDDT